MGVPLTYRLFEKNDLDGVLRLWKEESGWGEITEQQFYEWYVNTPFGDCLTVVAIDENERIIGQAVFMPSKFYLAGEEKKALRLLAPIISKEFRDNIKSPWHPFYGMYKFGLGSATEQGYSVFYTFPIHSWLAVMRFFPRAGLHPVEMSEFDCYALRINETEHSRDQKISISPVNEFNHEFDGLWDSAVANFPIKCGIVRNAQWLVWKLSGRHTFEARNAKNELLGYISIDKKTSLIVDALAKTPKDLEDILGALIGFLKQNDEFGIEEIKLMKTDFLQNIVDKFGFSSVDFKFAFGCYAVDRNIPTEALTPDKWFMMPND